MKKRQSNPTVECPTCAGHGRISLTGLRRDTYKLLCEQGYTCRELAKKSGQNPSALSSRLQYLVSVGLAKCIRDGRNVYYSRR